MNTAAVIVSYNSAEHIGPCLDSCLAFRDSFQSGIAVVDNASTDGTCELVRLRSGVTLLANPANLGFAAAVNQGFHYAPDAEAVLVLNPDVILLQGPTPLQDELAAANVSAAAGLLLDSSGNPQTGFQVRRFPTPTSLIFEILGFNRIWRGNPVNRRYRCLDLDLSKSANVEQPPGACLLIRRQAWIATGGLDEGFFPVWFEDVDFLKRLADLGWHARFTPCFAGIRGATRSPDWSGAHGRSIGMVAC